MSVRDKNKSLRAEAEPSEEELTVVVMRFKGSGETIRKGFETVTQALQALAPPQIIAPPRHVRALASGSVSPRANGAPAAITEAEEPYEDGPDTEESIIPEPHLQKPRERKPAKMPTLVNDLDYQSGVSLADYVKEKKPKNATEKYLVVGGWFKHHRKRDEISVDHMFTCFSVMSWKDRPEDMGQLFRNLKSKQQWFDNGASKGLWKLTIKGLNHVDNKMGLDVPGE